MKTILGTSRLNLRQLSVADAPFMLSLLNEPSYLQFIGDKGVRTLVDARDYILKGPAASYEQFGFGLYLTELKENGDPIGICGLIKREALPDVDIGYALLPTYWGNGYVVDTNSAERTIIDTMFIM